MAEFRMPSLGADMEDGTLVEWLKHPGDEVKRGDVIAVVDTDKGAIEIEVFEDGVLEKTVVTPGEKVPVGTVLALIRGPHDTGVAPPVVTPSEAAVAPEAAPPASPAAPATPATTVPGGPPGDRGRREHIRVSPLARTLAADLGVDLTRVTGTGPQGAITRDDVERAATAPPSRPSPRDRKTGMRAAIAAAMARSKREIPHYYLSTTIDLERAVRWLRAHNERQPMEARVLPAVLLVKAVARAVVEVPDLNGFWVDNAFVPGPGVHVGVAVSLRGGGLVAPAVHDVDALDVPTLMGRLRDLVTRARAGTLRSSELSDATITVTNLGDQGVDTAYGIIYPPQVALVGFGRIAERPCVIDGAVTARPLVTATLSGDHRASDGHRGGVFLASIDRWLQKPEAL